MVILVLCSSTGKGAWKALFDEISKGKSVKFVNDNSILFHHSIEILKNHSRSMKQRIIQYELHSTAVRNKILVSYILGKMSMVILNVHVD